MTDTLGSGSSLVPSNSPIVSQNGIFTLTVSPNGLCFMTNTRNSERYWVVGKIGQGNPALVMQLDGNLVLQEGNPPWDPFTSGTPGYGGATARLLNNGNLVVYDANGNLIWSSNTAQAAALPVQPTLNDARVALQAALGKLAIVERVLNDSGSLPERSNEANVNVRNNNATAE